MEYLTKEFEKVIVEWLKTDENATNLAYTLSKIAKNKALTLNGVNNRRKLLIDFVRKTSKVREDDKGNMWLVEKCVDEHLKGN